MGEGELLEIFMSTERVTRLDLFFPHFLRNCYFSPPPPITPPFDFLKKKKKSKIQINLSFYLIKWTKS